MPGLGGGAGAGALDFLRNNPQVSHFLCGVTEDSVAAARVQFATRLVSIATRVVVHLECHGCWPMLNLESPCSRFLNLSP
jgi:hypothetical protein